MYLKRAEQRVVAALCVKRLIDRRTTMKNRTMWVHPICAKRFLQGAFTTLYSTLRNDEQKFFNYFRMSIRTFDELYSKLENTLTFSDHIRISISSVERLCVALRYLASGNTFTDLHYTYRLGISTISNIVELVCDIIWELIGPESFPERTTEDWLDIAHNFNVYANFPNCIGAVDGKHIRWCF